MLEGRYPSWNNNRRLRVVDTKGEVLADLPQVKVQEVLQGVLCCYKYRMSERLDKV